MKDSRRKGIRGELEACEILNGLTTLQWERTAQRWGCATSDIWVPARPTLELHVEVKRIGKGLQTFMDRVERYGIIQTGDDLYACKLTDLRRALVETPPARHDARVFNIVAQFMAQADEDRRPTEVPIVLCRQDQYGWVAVWQYRDDDRLRQVLTKYLREAPCEANP